MNRIKLKKIMKKIMKKRIKLTGEKQNFYPLILIFTYKVGALLVDLNFIFFNEDGEENKKTQTFSSFTGDIFAGLGTQISEVLGKKLNYQKKRK